MPAAVRSSARRGERLDHGIGLHVQRAICAHGQRRAQLLRSVGRTSEAATLLGEAAALAEQLGYVVARRRAEDAQRALTA